MTTLIKGPSAGELKIVDRLMKNCTPYLPGCGCGLQTRWWNVALLWGGLQMVRKLFFLPTWQASTIGKRALGGFPIF